MIRTLMALLACATLTACGQGGSTDDGALTSPSPDTPVSSAVTVSPSPTDPAEVTPNPTDPAEDPQASREVGYEIMEVRSPTEIITWASAEMTIEEFEAIELPAGWFKNQPREIEMDEGVFHRSPSAEVDGEFVREELFGYNWTHVATVIETNIPMDDEGLLTGSTVHKYHQITYFEDRSVFFLISPEGEQFIRVSRDAGRTSDIPTMPQSWQHLEVANDQLLTLDLPENTWVIRADNEDSFQGPILID